MSAEDAALLTYLQGAWSQLFHLTTLEQGMQALGQPPDIDRRLRLGDVLLAQLEIHPTVERWGARTLILTEREKRAGRYLAQGAGQSMALADAAAAVDATPADLQSALQTLRHVGLLAWHLDDGETLAYQLAPSWGELAGPLGFTFHTVQRATGERFNVPCAVDFLLLAHGEYPEERIEITDSCAHCTSHIGAVIERGAIVAVVPPEALVFRGGG